VSQEVARTSRTPGIATVAPTGDRSAQITAVAPGSTMIVASFGGSAGTVTVLVSAALRAQLVVGGFTKPLYLTQSPGDTSRLFVVEQGGLIWAVRNGTKLFPPFLNIQSLVAFGPEQGLLSMAFHPNYANNGQFFVDYTDYPSGNIQVVRYTVSANPDVADAGSAQPIITVPHSATDSHNGGLVTFGPDGFLYIGVGDGSIANAAQDTTILLGKLLRIDVNGALPYVVPASNPFVGRLPARPEIWAYGLRNPWRFSFDRLTGQLYIADVGEETLEEVDVQPATSTGGENYGWSILEGTACYDATPCSSVGTVLPVFEYPHSGGSITGCAITGGYVYRGARFPLLAGHYFYGDYCAGWVRSLRYASGVVSDHHDYTPDFGLLGNITSFGEDTRGELYVVAEGGNIYRIAPVAP
jgi:glucose/arabinose dehydrogenase